MCTSVGANMKLPSFGGQLFIPGYPLLLSPHLFPIFSLQSQFSSSPRSFLPQCIFMFHHPTLSLCGGFCGSCWCRPSSSISVTLFPCHSLYHFFPRCCFALSRFFHCCGPQAFCLVHAFCFEHPYSLRDSNSSLFRI